MKKITFLLFLFPFLVHGQNPDWLWAKNHSLGSNNGRQYHAVDSNGEIYLAGDFSAATITIGTTTLTNTAPGFWDFYLIKYSKDGNVLWAKSYGGNAHDSVTAIALDNSGNVLLTGSYQQSLTLGSDTLTTSGISAYFAKLDSSGNVLWAKTHVETDGNSWVATSIDTDASGNFYMTGSFNMPALTFGTTTLIYDNYATLGNADRVWLGKFDANGNCLWLRGAQSTVVNATGSLAFDIAVDNSGGICVAGRFNNAAISFGSVTLTKTAPYDYNANMFVVKYDNSGNALWAKNAGTIYENLTYAHAIKTDAVNNVYVSGFFSNTINFDNISLMSIGGSKPYTVKFSPDGNALWAKTPASNSCAGNTLSSDVDADGNLYIAGYTNCPTLGFGNGVNLSMSGEGGLYVVKYNPEGNAVWARKSSATNINNVTSIDCHSSNEIYVAGTFWSPTISFGSVTLTKSAASYDLYLAKLNYTPLGNDEFNRTGFTVSPNPASGQIFLQNLPSQSEYNLFDLAGKSIGTGSFSDTSATLSLESFSSGIYFIKVWNDSGYSSARKIVKE